MRRLINLLKIGELLNGDPKNETQAIWLRFHIIKTIETHF